MVSVDISVPLLEGVADPWPLFIAPNRAGVRLPPTPLAHV